MAKRKKKIRCYIQGRKLKGKSPVTALADGMFVYRGELFDIEDFPPQSTINLDKSKVQSHGYFQVSEPSPKKKKKKKRGYRTKYLAYLFSNIEDCPDVKNLLQA